MQSEMTEILYKGTQPAVNATYPEVPPIYGSTAYVINDTKDYDFAVSGEKYYYNRTANPNRNGLAESISYLENGEETIVCSSGMGAISTTLLALLKNGDHAIFSSYIYGETIELETLLRKNGIEITTANFTETEKLEQLFKSNTKLVYTEIIANPLTQVSDIRKISAVAKKHGCLTVVDSTFTTPFVIKPLNFGADIVIHSLTKFFGGHSDASGGSITASKDIIKKIKPTYLLLGSALDANSSWLIHRSIKTMALRMREQLKNAVIIAEALEKNSSVKEVYFPGLKSHPQHKLASEIFLEGFGAIISFRVENNRDKVDEFIHKLEIVKYVGTLGGIRTTIAHPFSAFRGEFTDSELNAMGINEGIIRISVGVEDADDIINDFYQALKVF